MTDDTQPILPRALLLDMDGTLTEPLLDFNLIRSEMGIADGHPILEAMAEMPADKRESARQVLERHELAAADASTLSIGCRDLLDWLAHRRIGTALVTRNSRGCAEHVLRKHKLTLDVLITRDDPPFKPDPRSILRACEKLNVETSNVWMIGDGIHDIEAGTAAGVRTVWLGLGRKQRPFAAVPWRVAENLAEVTQMLIRCAPRPPYSLSVLSAHTDSI